MYFWTSCLTTISINFIHSTSIHEIFGFTLLHHANVIECQKVGSRWINRVTFSETALQKFAVDLQILIFLMFASWSLVTCVDLSVVELEDSVRVHLVRETSDTQHTNTMLARLRYRCSTVQCSRTR